MIYIKDDQKIVWNKFLKLIAKDKDIIELRNNPKSGLASVGIMYLISLYVVEKDEDFGLDTAPINQNLNANNNENNNENNQEVQQNVE